MPLVSITRLRLRSWLFLLMFAWYTLRSSRQAARAEGNLGLKLLRDRCNTFWTSTLWTGEAAMKMFMTLGAHGKAMRKLAEWCDEAAVAHWTQDSAETADLARSLSSPAKRWPALEGESPIRGTSRLQISGAASLTPSRIP